LVIVAVCNSFRPQSAALLIGGGNRTDLPPSRLGSLVLFDSQIEKAYHRCVSRQKRGKADVLQGTLDLMVLQTLATLGPSHGYAIASRLEQVSGGTLQLNMGTLYPALMRLEQRGFITGAWAVTKNNRKARFYTIAKAGHRQLAVERTEWDRMVSIIQALLSEQA
jgi:transcriptional regulator